MCRLIGGKIRRNDKFKEVKRSREKLCGPFRKLRKC
jgi:hypothetical protein